MQILELFPDVYKEMDIYFKRLEMREKMKAGNTASISSFFPKSQAPPPKPKRALTAVEIALGRGGTSKKKKNDKTNTTHTGTGTGSSVNVKTSSQLNLNKFVRRSRPGGT